jgi:hypothetical protein
VPYIFIDGGGATYVIFACGKELLDTLTKEMYVPKVKSPERSRGRKEGVWSEPLMTRRK